ncbi:MAG: hypothetical protein M0Z69_12330 [Actinomycetota bacterium]|nr:hypothetical protein [Actinomycetota bacterium]
MRVSGFWSAVGLIIGAGIFADLITHPTGSKTAFNGVNGLVRNTGNIVTGKG